MHVVSPYELRKQTWYIWENHGEADAAIAGLSRDQLTELEVGGKKLLVPKVTAKA